MPLDGWCCLFRVLLYNKPYSIETWEIFTIIWRKIQLCMVRFYGILDPWYWKSLYKTCFPHCGARKHSFITFCKYLIHVGHDHLSKGESFSHQYCIFPHLLRHSRAMASISQHFSRFLLLVWPDGCAIIQLLNPSQQYTYTMSKKSLTTWLCMI